MFQDYCLAHPFEQLLHGAFPRDLVPPSDDRAAWERLPKPFVQEILKAADTYAAIEYPMRLATGFLAFVRTGSRACDENPYFIRRRKLCVSCLLCCLDPKASLDDVVDGIVCICEETSWVISAHNINAVPGAPAPKDMPLPDPQNPYVDLFAAQTAMILAFVCRLLQKRLDEISPLIRRRAEKEIQKRVLIPFMETDAFWWMGVLRHDLNNWTPWILSNILMSACQIPTEPYTVADVFTRAMPMLDRWLDVVPEDGGCDEGAGYWNMAGGALLDCLELFSEATNGAMTFWQDEKIRRILSFPMRSEIGDGWFVNFADCDARPFLSSERLLYAGEMLGEACLIAMSARVKNSLMDQLNDVPHFSRLLKMLFHPVPSVQTGVLKDDVWLPDLELRVVRRGGMTLCCKGGHNGESHNHNDVGSFMLYADGRPQIIDAGNMTYTAKTFSDERYTLWNVRAAYHNLPMIGNYEEQPGREYKASNVRCLPDGLTLDIAKAYSAAAGVRKLTREFRLTGDALFVRDAVELSHPNFAAWVFMLRNQPVVAGGKVMTDSIVWTVPAGWKIDVETIPVTDARMSRNFPGSLYRVLITAPAQSSFTVQWIFGRREQYA